jgi:hypothetical protein
MAVTYFNSTTQPADNASQAGPTVAVAPPGSMVTGDLVCLVAGYKAGGVTFAMSNTGGQTWSAAIHGGGATSGVRIALFWCRYNGTWSANPSVTITAGTLAMSVQMHVFRPTSGTNTWSVINAAQVKDNAATGNITTQTQTLAVGDLGFACCISNDDNTYSNISTYTTAGTVQYRNLQGNDIAMGAQYRIEDTAANSVTATWQQATLGNDTWGTIILGFRETAGGSFAATTSGSGTLAATLIGIAALASSLTATAGVSGTLTGTAPVASDQSATGSLSATGALIGAASANLSSVGSVEATLTASGAIASSLSGTATFQSGLTGTGELASNHSATGSQSTTLTANVPASADLIATGSISTALTGTGAVTSTQSATGSLSATLSEASGSPSVNLTSGSTLSATLSAVGNIATNTSANSSLSATGSLSLDGSFDTLATTSFSASLTGVGALSTNTIATGSLSATIYIDAAEITAHFTATASLIALVQNKVGLVKIRYAPFRTSNPNFNKYKG